LKEIIAYSLLFKACLFKDSKEPNLWSIYTRVTEIKKKKGRSNNFVLWLVQIKPYSIHYANSENLEKLILIMCTYI
jgi:hypothetical protein